MAKPNRQQEPPPPTSLHNFDTHDTSDQTEGSTQVAIKSMVNTTPMAQALSIDLSSLPDPVLPDLQSIKVTIPAPPSVQEEDLIERFEELRLDYAEVTPLGDEDTIMLGDWVRLHTIGYAEERVLPYSFHESLEMLLEPHGYLPGFCESLVGMSQGETRIVQITLPEDYPVPLLQGKPAAFAVQLHEAKQVHLPEPEDQAFLKSLQMGATLEDIFSAICTTLEEEKSEELAERSTNKVLDTLVFKSKVRIPEGLIHDEIRQMWRKQEGVHMANREFSQEEQKQALEGWLADLKLRAAVRKRIGVVLVLRQLVHQHFQELPVEEFAEFIVGFSESLGFGVRDFRYSVTKDPTIHRDIIDKFLHIKAVDYVMSQVTVQFKEE
mgnify:CR=1 FL=1